MSFHDQKAAYGPAFPSIFRTQYHYAPSIKPVLNMLLSVHSSCVPCCTGIRCVEHVSSPSLQIVLIFCDYFTAGYFLIDEPALKREWSNNAANLVSWQKGVLDGIYGFDVEMARMSTDGLMLVARNGKCSCSVPGSMSFLFPVRIVADGQLLPSQSQQNKAN